MTIAGIDYSMTSPAICFYDMGVGDCKFENCEIYYLTQSKKYEVSFKNVCGNYFEYDDDLNKRYDLISSYFLDRIYERDVTKVFIEGYSMGSSGRVFNIAENTGILKYRFWNLGIEYAIVPPTVIKKFATGKGNANKERMQEVFESKHPIRLKEELKQTEKQWNPSSDIIDAYYICKYGATLLTN
jgi:Holliday junction resolvasome RuvABC endonuclease subunit